MKSEQNSSFSDTIMEDELTKKATPFFKENWFSFLIGLLVGIFIGAIPALIVIIPLAVLFYYFIKHYKKKNA